MSKILSSFISLAVLAAMFIVAPSPAKAASLIVSDAFVSFNYTKGGTVPALYTAHISNNSESETINYTISVPNQPAWLNATYNTNPLSLAPLQTGGIGVAVDPVNLSAGTYTTTIYFTGNFTNSPASIAVTLYVTGSNVQITTSSNLPNATVGQTYSTQLQATGGTAPYTWSPVSTTFPSGCCVLGINTGTGEFNTQSSATVLGPAGNYSWVIKVTDANGNTATKTFYLTINPAPNTSGAFSITKLSFDFYATEGDTAYQYQSLEFTNVSGATLTYTLSVDNQPAWLNASYNTNPLPAYAGVASGLGAQVNPTNLPAGKYSTSIKISGSFSGSPVIIPVNLTIYPKLPSIPQPVSGPAHPSNTNILGPDGTVYLIQGGYRSPYTSAGAFLSYGFNYWASVMPATTGDMNLPLSNYTPSGSTNTVTYFIPPRNGSLINDRGTIYLITNGLRIGFASEQAFLGLGYSYATVQPGDTSFMVALAPINSNAMSHPDGTLVNDNGTIYIMKNNTKMGFPSLQVFFSWGFELNEVVPANSYDRGAPVSGLVNTRMANQLSI